MPKTTNKTNKNNNPGYRPRKKQGTRIEREQPSKDSKSRRINFDNERQSKFDKEFPDTKMSNKCNDIRWYSRSPKLVEGAGRLTTYNVLGKSLGLYTSDIAVPGVMSAQWFPYLTGVDTTAINQAAKCLYSEVVHANSRNTSYTAEDLMMYTLAGASVYSLMSHLIRAYGVMKWYDEQNSYLPDILLEAMGFDASDCRANYSKMWFDINRLIALCQNIWIPNTMPIIERWFWMNANVYQDDDVLKAQYYVFVPKRYLMLDETGDENGTRLAYTAFFPDNNNPIAWAAAVSNVEGAINTLLRSEYRGVIYGDILKCYGPEKLYHLNEIDINYKTVPVYDQEVLMQFENMDTFRFTPQYLAQHADSQEIYSYFSEAPTTTASNIVDRQMIAPEARVLNFHTLQQPTPEQIMIATRLSWVGLRALNDGDKVYYLPDTCGTELIAQCVMYRLINQSSTGGGAAQRSILNTFMNTYQNTGLTDLVAQWVTFDWAPILYGAGMVTPSVSPSPVLLSQIWCDFANYMLIGKQDLEKLHNAAVFSELGVPQF